MNIHIKQELSENRSKQIPPRAWCCSNPTVTTTLRNDIGDFAAIADGSFSGGWQVTCFMKTLATTTRPIMAAVQGRSVGTS